jgi:hypothetical protein
VLFTNRLLGVPLHPGQVKYLFETTARRNKINLLVPANRWGKSTMLACLQLWYLFYKFGIPPGNATAWQRAEYRTANVAPHASLVEPVFKYIDQIMTSTFPIRLPGGRMVLNDCLLEWFYLKERTASSPPYKQYFAYNSYIEHRTIGATASDSLEGKPFGLITYDEGGRSHHLEAEVNGTFLSRLFDWNGPLHIPSTPDAASPSLLYHYQMYQDGLVGLNDTFTMEGELRDNTFFPPGQIDDQYQLYAKNPLKDQVLHGKFVFAGDTIYDAASILAAQDESLDIFEPYQDGHSYVIGSDTAIGSDEIVHTVLDISQKPFRVVRKLYAKGNAKSPQLHLNDFIDLVLAYCNADKTNLRHMLETWNGESVRFYHDLPYWLQALTKCYGSWQPEVRANDNENKAKNPTRDVKKADILIALKKLLEAGELKFAKNDKSLREQLAIYREKDDKIPTDHVISLALACWLATEGAAFRAPVLSFIDL